MNLHGMERAAQNTLFISLDLAYMWHVVIEKTKRLIVSVGHWEWTHHAQLQPLNSPPKKILQNLRS
jgi:hypothetical protein